MLQDPISKPPDHMSMDVSARGAGAADHRRNKPNSANSEQVLKCPRCDSLNTKFCYYNNYSLTQPRHFCKNCRRYWTQGGSLRNVPIGGGCRKNKRVKQRTVDPHLFGGLVGGEDQYSGPGSFLMQHAAGTAAASGVPSSLLSGSLFNVGGAPVSSCVPGSFSDLVPGNDSYLLSMAFSRLHEESLRLSSTPDHQLQANKPLSFLHSANPLYDTPALACNNYVKPEHHHAFNGSDQLAAGLFNEHPGASSAPILSSSADGLASLDHDQISNFGVPASHVQGACSSGQLDAHLRLQQQRAAQALALHLGGSGAASDQHPMHMNPASCSRTVGLSSVVLDESSSRSLNPERYLDFHHRHHSALPGFEDQESPDQSMSSIMMRRGGQANCKLFPTEGMDNMADERSQLVVVSEGWAQQVTGTDHHQTHANGPCATDAYHDQPVTSGPSAGDQQAHISFWSPSPWSASSTHEDMHAAGAGLL